MKGWDLRKNLITVPSCYDHNSKKSHDDEFLLACLTGILGNNFFGFYHTQTKVRRALERKDVGFFNQIMTQTEELFYTSKSGTIYPLLKGVPNYLRLSNCFHHIACGLYYLEFGKRFVGEHSIIFGFISYKEATMNKIKEVVSKRFKHDENKLIKKGENPEIFHYSFVQPDEFGLIALRMVFYEGASVYVSFKDEAAKIPQNLAMDFIKAGIKTIVGFGEDDFVEFN